MNDEFEVRLGRALRSELDVVRAENLRFSAPTPSGLRTVKGKSSALVVVAAVAMVLAVLAVGVVFAMHRSANPSDPAAPAGAAVDSNVVAVQGALIYLPAGMRAVDASSVESDITNPYQFCFLPAGVVLGSAGCLGDHGVLVRVARTGPGHPVEPVQGSFQSACGGLPGRPTIPMLTHGTIGAKTAASIITITCGSDTASSSTYWETADRTFTVQSPYNGVAGREIAELVVLRTDLSHWAHSI